MSLRFQSKSISDRRSPKADAEIFRAVPDIRFAEQIRMSYGGASRK